MYLDVVEHEDLEDLSCLRGCVPVLGGFEQGKEYVVGVEVVDLTVLFHDLHSSDDIPWAEVPQPGLHQFEQPLNKLRGEVCFVVVVLLPEIDEVTVVHLEYLDLYPPVDELPHLRVLIVEFLH